MKRYILTIFVLFLYTAFGAAQPDSVFPMKTCPFDLTYDSTKNIIDSTRTYIRVFTSTSSIYGVKKVLSLNDSGLVIRKNSKSFKLKVDDIKSVKFYDGTKADKFMLLGAAVGFAGIVGLYSLSGDSSFTGFLTALCVGAIVAVPCALIGSIVGLFFEDSHPYNLSGLTTEKKKAKLIKIFRQFRN